MPIDWKITLPITAAIKPIVWTYKQARTHYLKKWKKFVFVFEEYTKKVTIYRNGHGILENNFKIHILDNEAFESFDRLIKIRDACKDTYFDYIKDMRRVDPQKRFEAMGFWYEPEDLIKDVISQVDEKSKHLEWSFLIDKNKIKSSNTPKISIAYALSIPCMFPITNSYFDPEKAPIQDNSYMSGLKVAHKIFKLNYIISFEKGIKIEKHPTFEVYPHGTEHGHIKTVAFSDESDIFYNRYVARIIKPDLGASIKASWKIKKSGN